MFAKLSLALLLAVCISRSTATVCTIGGSAPSCGQKSCKTANPTKLFCNVGCNGANPNNFNIDFVKMTQGGNPINQNGGISIKNPMQIYIQGTNNIGKVTNPLVDVVVSQCNHGFFGGSCSWKLINTFGLTSNLNPCDPNSGIMFDDCHLSKYPKGQKVNITITLDLSKNPVLSHIVGILTPNLDYQLEVTFKDGQNNKLMCVDATDTILD